MRSEVRLRCVHAGGWGGGAIKEQRWQRLSWAGVSDSENGDNHLLDSASGHGIEDEVGGGRGWTKRIRSLAASRVIRPFRTFST